MLSSVYVELLRSYVTKIKVLNPNVVSLFPSRLADRYSECDVKFCLMKMEKITKELTAVVATITKPKIAQNMARDKRIRGQRFISAEQIF